MAIGHHPRRRLVRRALSGDHVGRDRPWRAAEANQRDVWCELAADAAQRFIHRLEFAEIGLGSQPRHLLRRIQRIEPRAFAGLEAYGAAERIGNDEDVGKDDRGIEVETADRLQRHFGGIFRRKAQIEEAARLGAQLAILRQVPAGLPHHPDRRYRLSTARQYLEKRFGGFLGQSKVPARTDDISASDTRRFRLGQGEKWNKPESRTLIRRWRDTWLRNSIPRRMTSMPPTPVRLCKPIGKSTKSLKPG